MVKTPTAVQDSLEQEPVDNSDALFDPKNLSNLAGLFDVLVRIERAIADKSQTPSGSGNSPKLAKNQRGPRD